MLFQLKEYPPEASPAVILRYIERYRFLHELGVETLDLSSISPPLIRYLADMMKRYDVRALQRFAGQTLYADGVFPGGSTRRFSITLSPCTISS